ncbi:MAG: immunity 49 family protein, partial [Planctomycetales bacterium]|nr:immunity 49 family protein [Planctomycetales bacterium]
MDLNLVFQNLASPTSHHLGIVATDLPLFDRAKHLEELSRYFQAYGICFLLMDFDTGQFCEFLTRSASTNRYMRMQAQRAGLNELRTLALSRTEAFFDALVAGRLGLATDIVSLAAHVTWHREWEYEDDYYYMRFLHGLVGGQAEEELLDYIDAIDRIQEEGPSARLGICNALIRRDSGLFATELQRLLDEKQEKDDIKRPNCGDWDTLFWPQSFLSIEGLALLQVASLVGIVPSEEFALCPSHVRIAFQDQPFEDSFGEIA